MKLLLLLAMLTVCDAGLQGIQDLSGKMFTFPQPTKTDHVKLITDEQNINAATICHRSITDLKRSHSLFSLATSSIFNDILIYSDGKDIFPHIKDKKVGFSGYDYNVNMWHTICTTWDSQSGLVQMWFDGQPSIRKFISSGTRISGKFAIILGQEQDSYAGGFDINQSFVGMISDVHMWDYVLSPCEIQKYVNELNFTPGNVLNWSALKYEITGKVLLENKQMLCH